ncbi:MAG: hypothetical protein RID42_00230 [Alphaproteobacteria bacterium]
MTKRTAALAGLFMALCFANVPMDAEPVPTRGDVFLAGPNVAGASWANREHCAGRIDTPECAGQTILACLTLRMRGACDRVGFYDELPAAGKVMDSGQDEAEAGAARLFRLRVTATLDTETAAAFVGPPPAEPGWRYVEYVYVTCLTTRGTWQCDPALGTGSVYFVLRPTAAGWRFAGWRDGFDDICFLRLWSGDCPSNREHDVFGPAFAALTRDRPPVPAEAVHLTRDDLVILDIAPQSISLALPAVPGMAGQPLLVAEGDRVNAGHCIGLRDSPLCAAQTVLACLYLERRDVCAATGLRRYPALPGHGDLTPGQRPVAYVLESLVAIEATDAARLAGPPQAQPGWVFVSYVAAFCETARARWRCTSNPDFSPDYMILRPTVGGWLHAGASADDIACQHLPPDYGLCASWRWHDEQGVLWWGLRGKAEGNGAQRTVTLDVDPARLIPFVWMPPAP